MMSFEEKDFLKNVLAGLEKIDYIKPEDIPSIPLYMDQVTTFMENQLATSRRHEDDKILTKTMINNYAKNHLLPPPEKKKYTTEHLLVMIFIYYFKSILSINDIQTLFQPITSKYFNKKRGFSLTDIYNEVFSLENDQIDRLGKDIARCFHISKDTFSDAPEEDREFLHQFSFICLLSFDVYIKKMMIEKMIDEIATDIQEKDTNKKNNNKMKG